jgi:hypothetical protein
LCPGETPHWALALAANAALIASAAMNIMVTFVNFMGSPCAPVHTGRIVVNETVMR